MAALTDAKGHGEKAKNKGAGQLVTCLPGTRGALELTDPQYHRNWCGSTGLVKPGVREVEAGGSGVQGHPQREREKQTDRQRHRGRRGGKGGERERKIKGKTKKILGNKQRKNPLSLVW